MSEIIIMKQFRLLIQFVDDLYIPHRIFTDNTKNVEYNHVYPLNWGTVGLSCAKTSSMFPSASSKVYNSKEERHKTHTTETNNTINNVTVRKLHPHVLPRLSHVI